MDQDGDGKYVDLGAAWINDTNQAAVFALTRALGLQTVVQNTSGNVVQQDIDGSVSQFIYGGAPQVRVMIMSLTESQPLFKHADMAARDSAKWTASVT